jgi:hypothetical protein
MVTRYGENSMSVHWGMKMREDMVKCRHLHRLTQTLLSTDLVTVEVMYSGQGWI